MTMVQYNEMARGTMKHITKQNDHGKNKDGKMQYNKRDEHGARSKDMTKHPS